MTEFFFLVMVFAIAFVLTALLRSYALKRNVLDIPNARSSHQVPTPRGGGVAIVLSVLAALPVAVSYFGMDGLWALKIAIATLIIAAVGFADDHQHIAARWRLVWHFSAAALVVWAVGGLPPLQYFGTAADLGWLGHFAAVVAVVWMINLTNFMDGIDGLAASQTIFVCVGLALLSSLVQPTADLWLALLVLCASAGFLCWNFPPARIFMGDAGSGFLGLILAAIMLHATQAAPQLFWSGVILYGYFIVDATYTLIRRLLNGKKLYEAHRSHAYQIASRRWSSHKKVTLSVQLLNLCWLLPLAALVAYRQLDGLVAVLLAYVPLGVIVSKFDAGSEV
ncbi:MraY family glycosyltransferase [Rheinheimera sp.]|uniref:MraY family glycosyltransferase n=1 Tax=Rheinheimera sp. TaxID=1869214 RepID=UPI003D2D8837